ncbi:MAG: TRAP transporter small permease [Actinobacteria bacterium]|nr:TRAP transporter small permease [Actinomycetota bacterium]
MEKKLRQIVEPTIERINRVLVIGAGLLIVIMGFLSAYGAIRRYVFRSPEPVSYEFAAMFVLISFVLALAAVERQDRMLRNDLLLDRFSPRVRNVVSNIIGPLMGMTFFGIIMWYSFGDALRALEIGQVSHSAFPVRLFPVKIFVPIGYGFLCLVLFLRCVLGLLRLKPATTEATQEVVVDDLRERRGN